MIEWLLDLDALRFGQEGVEFGFARPLPAWAWALLVAGALALAAISYRRLEGGALWRGALAAMRGALLVTLAVLIAGPRLIKPNETEEKDWVLVLVDRSQSLKIADVDAPGGAERLTREAQLRRILERNSNIWDELSQDRIVQWLGFDASTYELDVEEAPGGLGPVIDPGQPDGRRTAIGRALSEAMRRAAARPVSAIVILSDGQSADEPDRATIRALTNGQIPVYSIPLGSEGAATDYAVRIDEAPRVAFTNDMVPVDVRIDRLGDAAAGRRITAQLIDNQTGLKLDEEEVVFEEGDEVASATLVTQPKDAVQAQWSVRLVMEPADLISDNNAAELEVELVDRPMRVVYFDGYSRWEYRYIKNLFVREDSIDSSVLLLAPNRKYLQEGDIPLDILPTSPEEWAEFDVVMLGDLRPEMFTEEQLEQLREHVALRGAGLVWIAGEGSTPAEWAGTPLADLLPFAMSESGGVRPPSRWSVPVTMHTTAAADRLGVLRLAEAPNEEGSWWPARLSDPATGWSQLRFAQRIEQGALKPTAEVLATAQPVTGGADAAPLVISMRYGAGRVLYVGTDEIWRWRYGRGEYYPERFWLQMVRLLGRERLARAGKSAVLTVSPMRGEVGRPMRVGVELVDQLLLDAAPPSLRARVQRIGEAGSRVPDPDRAQSEVTDLLLQPERTDAGFGRPSEMRHFAATWLPHASGRYQIEVADPLFAGGSLRAEADVWRPDDEMRRPQTDHAMLAGLGEATGGRLIQPADLLRPDLIPNRKVRIIGAPEVEDLWDTPLALIIVVTLLTLEWVGRRLLRLA